MGWYGSFAEHYNKDGKVDRKAEVEENCRLVDGYTVLKTVMVGTTAYRAIRNDTTGEVTADIILTSVYKSDGDTWFDYKPMEEDWLPYYYDCPNSILKLLTPTDDENSNEWRERCRENNEAKKAKKKDPNALNNLPVWSVIKFKIGDGREIEATKYPASYQFKRPFWVVNNEFKYIPKNRIPKDYEVVTRK